MTGTNKTGTLRVGCTSFWLAAAAIAVQFSSKKMENFALSTCFPYSHCANLLVPLFMIPKC